MKKRSKSKHVSRATTAKKKTAAKKQITTKKKTTIDKKKKSTANKKSATKTKSLPKKKPKSKRKSPRQQSKPNRLQRIPKEISDDSNDNCDHSGIDLTQQDLKPLADRTDRLRTFALQHDDYVKDSDSDRETAHNLCLDAWSVAKEIRTDMKLRNLLDTNIRGPSHLCTAILKLRELLPGISGRKCPDLGHSLADPFLFGPSVIRDLKMIASKLREGEIVIGEPGPNEESETSQPDRTPRAKSERVALFDQKDQPLIGGSPVETLTTSGYNVVKTLIEAGGNGLTKDELLKKSRRGGARGILKRLAEKSDKWRSVIKFPETPGKGYRID